MFFKREVGCSHCFILLNRLQYRGDSPVLRHFFSRLNISFRYQLKLPFLVSSWRLFGKEFFFLWSLRREITYKEIIPHFIFSKKCPNISNPFLSWDNRILVQNFRLLEDFLDGISILQNIFAKQKQKMFFSKS